MLLHKCIKVWLQSLLALTQHFVEVANHFAQMSQVFGGHILQGLLHALKELLHHLLLQTIHQFFELLPRLVIHKIIFGETFYLTWQILRKVIEIVQFALGNHLQHSFLLLK